MSRKYAQIYPMTASFYLVLALILILSFWFTAALASLKLLAKFYPNRIEWIKKHSVNYR